MPGVFLLLLACGDGEDPSPAPRDSAAATPVLRSCPDPGPMPDIADDGTPSSAIFPAGLGLVAGSGSVVYVGSHSTGLWRADASGGRWTSVAGGVTHETGDLALDPADPLRIVHSAGGVLERSLDGGTRWERLPFGGTTAGSWGADAPVYAVARAPWDPRRLYAVTHMGTYATSSDEGSTWVEGPSIPMASYQAGFGFHGWRILAPSVEGGAVLIADTHGIWRLRPGDARWQGVLGVPVPGAAVARDPRDLAHLLAPGWESRDGGTRWSALDTPEFTLLAASDAGAWAGLDAHGVRVSRDARAWDHAAAPVGMPHGLGFLGERLYVVGTEGVAWSADLGGTWERMPVDGLEDGGMAVVRADPVCPGVVWTASRCGGGVFVSEDWGRTWEHLEGPHHYVMDVHLPTYEGERAWIVSDDALWMGDSDARAFELRVRDYHYHGFAIDPTDAETLLLGSVGSGEYADTRATIYRSEDAGQTWVATSGIPETPSSAHTLVWLDGDVVLAGFYLGGNVSHVSGDGIGLWRSTDGGRSWSDTGVPARNVAALAYAGGRVWAATEQGVLLSVDAGRTWTVAREGRHFAVTARGDDVLALEAEGAVYVSNDRGESWRKVGQGPPSGGSTLAQVSLDAGGQVGWFTNYGRGTWAVRVR